MADIRSEFYVTHPDSVEATMTFTMTIGMWKKVQAQLKDAYPGWNINSAIRDMIDKASMKIEGKEGGEY